MNNIYHQLPVYSVWFVIGTIVLLTVWVIYLRFKNKAQMEDRDYIKEQADFMVKHDFLTELPNRYMLFEDLSSKHPDEYAILFIDLDRFKMINDSYGHESGDEILIQVSKRLARMIKNDTSVKLYRISGDEFILFCTHFSLEELKDLANKTLAIISNPFSAGDKSFYLTASIGIAHYPDQGSDLSRILKNADIAMFEAKKQGKGVYQFFTKDMESEALIKLEIEQELRKAIMNDQFMLVYQPQINLKTRTVECAEVLVRWNHPERGLIAPVYFIPVAEETNLIVDLTHLIIEKALKAKERFETADIALKLSLNVSANHFKHNIDELLGYFGEHNSSNLEIEITESALMLDMNAIIESLNKFNSKGITVAIDDFGTGYSSLSYIKKLPIHKLKIDKSFIDDIHKDKDDTAIVQAIIAMSHALNIKVCAEGVENTEQLDFLVNNGCDIAQGYLFSKPLTEDDLREYLARGI